MKIHWRTCFRVGISVLLLYLCIHYVDNLQDLLYKVINAIAPVIIGCAIAYVVNILMAFYEKHFFPAVTKKIVKRIKRLLCLIAAYISFVAIVALIVSLVLPELISCIELVLSLIPKALDLLMNQLKDDSFVPKWVLDEFNGFDWQQKLSDLIAPERFEEAMKGIWGMVSGVFSGVVSTVLSVIFSVYLLLSKDSLKANFNKLMDSYLKVEWCRKIRYVATELDNSFHGFIVGQSAEAVILGILCTLGMLALRLPYATMIGALVAFSALIPVVGAFIGASVGAFMIAMTSIADASVINLSSFVDALVFIVFIIILQQIEGNFIYPKVVGSSVGLPAIWVLAAVTIGGGVMGILGMLIGVPVAATIYKIVRNDVSKKISSDMDDSEDNLPPTDKSLPAEG